MKVLFYSQSSTIYGSPASLVNVISGLRKMDADLEVLVVIPSKGELEAKLKEEDVPYRIVPHYKWVYNNNIYQRKIGENRALAHLWLIKNILQRRLQNRLKEPLHDKLFEEFQPDMIYVNSSIAPMGCRMAVKHNCPFIWHHRETINDSVTGFYLDNTSDFRSFFKRADLHFYPSHFLKRAYSEFGGDKHKVIYNGVPDAPAYERKNSLGSPIKFGIAGRINQQKGQKEVLEVMKHLPEDYSKYELHIFGDGPTDFVTDLQETYADAKIVFRGFQEVNVVYENLDYLIVNGRNESFGRVVAEANARGIPVIARKSGALEEIVREDVNGLLYGTLEELAVELQRILRNELSSGTYADLSAASREAYENNFSIEICAKRIHEALQEMRPRTEKA